MSLDGVSSCAPAVEPRRAPLSRWRRDVSVLAAVALAVRVPAYLASAHLGFDDAVYGASAVAMRRGGLPFRDVFSSQGPLHLPIVFAGDLLGWRSASSPRLAATLSGVMVVVAVYAAARRLTSRVGALVAGTVVASSGCVLWTTGPITADGPAIALGATALALALRYRDSPTARRALATGVVLGAALSVKAPLVLTAAIPIAAFLLAPRRARDIAVAAAGAVGVGLAATLPWGVGRVWDQSVAYQIDSDRNASLRDNAEKIVSTLWERDPFLLAVAALVVVSVAWARARRRTVDGEGGVDSGSLRSKQRDAAAWPIVAWLVVLLLFLVVEPAMWRNHVAHIVAPAALLLALRPPQSRHVALAALVALPFQAAHLGALLSPDPYRGDEAAVVDALRALPDGAWAISDDPGLVWRSGRATPFDLVDTSVKRIQQGRITTETVAEAAADPHVCAVVVWSADHFGSMEELPDVLRPEGYSEIHRFDDFKVLYERSHCAPPD